MHGSARGDRQSISRANAKKVRHGLSIGFIAYFAAQDCATERQALSGARREAAHCGGSHVEPVLSLDPPIGRSPRRSARGAVGFFSRQTAPCRPQARPASPEERRTRLSTGGAGGPVVACSRAARVGAARVRRCHEVSGAIGAHTSAVLACPSGRTDCCWRVQAGSQTSSTPVIGLPRSVGAVCPEVRGPSVQGERDVSRPACRSRMDFG